MVSRSFASSPAGRDPGGPGEHGQVHQEDQQRVRRPPHRQDQGLQNGVGQAHARGLVFGIRFILSYSGFE